MTAIVVTAIGLRSCLGDGPHTWRRLRKGETGLAICSPFPDLSPFLLGYASPVPGRFLALVGELAEALAVDGGALPGGEGGLVLGSSRAGQGDWERGDLLVPQGLPQAGAIALARHYGITGPVLAQTAACATGIWSLAIAYEWLRQKRCDWAIAGAVEAPITPLTLTGFDRLGALASEGCYPFDRRRQGLALAEGGALFLLEPLAQAQGRGAKIYGEILGFGLQGDAYHRTTPEPQMAGARRAIAQCLRHGDLTADRIDVIHSHGTGTRLNDLGEGRLLGDLFPHRPAILSTKGATGHTLGASGAVAAALTCYALREQFLPPCVGLSTPDEAIGDLNFVRRPQIAHLQIALCESFGFGGTNAVIALKAPPGNPSDRVFVSP